MTPWLHIIGIGEDGFDGLATPARVALETADVVIGGNRHHALAPHLEARRIRWPTPFRTMADEIGELRGQQVAVLVTGDPMWFSAGARLARAFPEECEVYPQVSSFQLAAAAMKWSLADVDTLTIHGRPAEQIIPYFAPNARLLVLTQDGTSPSVVAKLLVERGYGASRLTVLGALGGGDETRLEGNADTWTGEAPALHVLAVECLLQGDGPDTHPVIGLPDDAYEHDGQITKREVRMATVSALSPRRGAVLWDIGAGSGSVGIEFMRAGRDAVAHAVECRPERAERIRRNAIALGTPGLKVVEAAAPEGLADLPRPDAVFVGGGLSDEVVDLAHDALGAGGRLVANAVTLESEGLLAELQGRYGGTLSRFEVSRAEKIGTRTGWRPMMPVTQWVLAK